MNDWFKINWTELFVPQTSLLEIFIRGTLMFFVLFFLLRFFRREVGGIGITDILVIVIIADAAQNGMAGEYKSITEGAFLVTVIVGWNYFLDFLAQRFGFVEKIMRPRAVALIKNGKLLRRNMQSERITLEELTSQLRQQGILDLSEVKECRLEGDGNISVIKQKTPNGEELSPNKNAKHNSRLS
jgi:uncharacterized membrane protein YcaP (DUF421 family)